VKQTVYNNTQLLIKDSQNSHSSNSQNELEGGISQEWKQILEIISKKLVEKQTPQTFGEEQVKQPQVKTQLNAEQLKNPYILNPDEYKNQEELFNAIEHWWIYKKRKSKETIKKRLPIARRMSKHPVFPINWQKIVPEQIIAYLEYREYKENAGAHAIINEWKTVNTFAKAYGIDTSLWGYVPPQPPKPKVKIVPLPDTVYKIIHHQYSKDKYTNALVQYILTHGFIIGWRPSEIVIQKTDDVYLEDGYIIITETKKHGQPRQVFLEEELMTKYRRKSLKNWIEHWRPKVANKHSENYLYLQPNGKPFTKDYLRKYINDFVKPVWKNYHLYIMRHWCAIARLIQSKEITKKWDIWDVKERLGHEKVTTTQNYVRFAKRYYENAKYDWIRAVLKFHQEKYNMEQINSSTKGINIIKSKTPIKTYVSSGNNRSELVRTWRDSNPRSTA